MITTQAGNCEHFVDQSVSLFVMSSCNFINCTLFSTQVVWCFIYAPPSANYIIAYNLYTVYSGQVGPNINIAL